MATSTLSCVCWEWRRDDGGFSPYPPGISAQIEAIKVSGRNTLTLTSYTVDVCRMVQINSSSGYERPVRRTPLQLSSSQHTDACWAWNERGTSFVLYDTYASIIIEESFRNADTTLDLSTSAVGLPYTIDFVHMEQTRHSYNTKRKIERKPLPPGSTIQSILATPISVKHNHVHSSNYSSTPISAPPGPSTSIGAPSVYSKSGPILSNPGAMYTGPSPMPTTTTPINPHLGIAPIPFPTGMSLATGYSPSVSKSSMVHSPPSSRTRLKKSAHTKSSPPVSRKHLENGNKPTSTTPTKSYGSTSVTKPHSSKRNTKTSTAKSGVTSGASTTSRKGNKSATGGRKGKGKASNSDASCGAVSTDKLSTFVRPVKWLNAAKDEPCPICMNELTEASGFDEEGTEDASPLPRLDVYKLRKCGHMLHRPCLLMYVKNNGTESGFQCPTCKKSYGVKMGNMPPGTMTVKSKSLSLPGHEGYKTIEIVYNFSPGHHNGRSYRTNGFPRICYLPDSPKGQKVLSLLRIAWERKLTFTIGTSVTTGATDTVVWNEIHHKTELSNYNGHGYPDPKYLDNVLTELAAQGVEEGGGEDGEEEEEVFVISSGSDDDL